MTIEEEFFKAFGLEPYYLYYVFDLQGRKDEYCFKKEEFIDFVKKDKRYLLLKVEKRTPEITDRKLLELIFILNDTFPEVINAYGTNWEYLKNYVLTRYITDHKYINKQQVKALFEDKEQ